MRAKRFRWLMVLTVIVALVILVSLLPKNRRSSSPRVVVSLIGYTNLPNDRLRFALFSLQNPNSSAIRWRGNYVEVEGSQYNRGPIVNSKLPFFTGVFLKGKDSLTVAIGEPTLAPDGCRWRFAALCSRYGFKERMLDFAMMHKLPIGIGRFSFVNASQILDPTNFVTNSSIWLVK